MERQEIFDKGYIAILQQGVPSIDPDMERCVYRGPDGVKCVAGYFIEDAEYSKRMEIFTANEGIVRELFLAKNIDPDFMRSLQEIHDLGPNNREDFIPFWKQQMKVFAEQNGLSDAVIKD